MSDEAKEIDRAARAMIANYGDSAEAEAQRRAENVAAAGVVPQAAKWSLIAKLVRHIRENSTTGE